MPKQYTLLGPDGPFLSNTPGSFGGHRRGKIYGRLDCSSAQRWIAKGHYVTHRVFFADALLCLHCGGRLKVFSILTESLGVEWFSVTWTIR